MTEVFKPDVLAAFMQQVMDQPTLPMLYLRTVIQIVTLYRQLQPYISSTLLNRLITKRVWTNPQQWEGFVRLAKATEPHCFDALLSLPKEPLQQLLSKQPSLKEPLKEHVVQRQFSCLSLVDLDLTNLDRSKQQQEQDDCAAGSDRIASTRDHEIA
jgi:symplekin